MLDIKFIKDNADLVKINVKNRRVAVDIDRLLKLDDERRSNLLELENMRAKRNQGSKIKPTPEQITTMRALSDQIKIFETKQNEIDHEYEDLMLQVPNMTHPETPIGGEEDFKVVGEGGKKLNFKFEAKDHEQLMMNLDLVDFERGAKVAGAKFYYFKNDAVRLNQALINYGMDICLKHGFTLLETPDMAKAEVLMAAGYNPRGEETQIYKIENNDLHLIGTAEITVLGYHANENLDLNGGPRKYVALSHCYRTEAGAYGKTSKGLYRVHQFTKLEMFAFCKPEESEALHEEIAKIEKEIVDGLGLVWRQIDIASGDLGGPAFRKYDYEAWMVMNQGYGEITSCSNCTDYQARRLNIKYKTEEGKNEFVHTLNGSAIVLSRFPLAIVEQGQNEDGSINIPKALRPYMGGQKQIKQSK